MFYRLNVFPILVPPLRHRKEDIPFLARHFMNKVSPVGPRRRLTLSEAALAMLQAYDWPGNIRQLENAIYRASVLVEGEVLTPEEFPQIRAQVEGTVVLEVPAPSVVPDLPDEIETALPHERPIAAEVVGDRMPRVEPRFG
ncbi:hypothetical protein V2143_21240, partial [Mycobacterium tuberculosis variant caprae]